jgi:hypothetical protein
MHCVENLLCVVLGARTHQFQEAKGLETENQLHTALVVAVLIMDNIINIYKTK